MPLRRRTLPLHIGRALTLMLIRDDVPLAVVGALTLLLRIGTVDGVVVVY